MNITKNNIMKHTFILVILLLVGCGGRNSPTIPVDPDTPDEPNDSLPIPDNSGSDHYLVLLMGNSHVGNLTEILETIFLYGTPDKTFEADLAPGSKYLADRLEDGSTLEAINSKNWTHVILQAQKYSSGGQNTYPTTAAELWIRRSKNISATPILFPEHPQRGNDLEGQYVYNLHKGIANRESACVAPVGPVWDEVLQIEPNLELHNADGNHASALGSFLTALIFYETITGNMATDVPYIENIGIDQTTQDLFKQSVSYILSVNIPCLY